MYKTQDNAKIGKYLDDLIKQSRFKKARPFGIAFLRERDGAEPSPEEIQNIQTRLSSMKAGTKGIQITDLPIFAKLLGVTVDDILSAGTYHKPSSARDTNYSIAFCKDKKIWKEYLNREDKPFLNPDEFNKTFLDYAIEAENYLLLKYLLDEGIVWFVGDEKDECYLGGFGAGTSIKRRDFTNMDLLNYNLKYQDDLRIGMIGLALKKNDFETLTKLKAREIPMLTTLDFLSAMSLKAESIPSSHNIDKMIELIASSDEKALSYFFEPFEVETKLGQVNTFVFPYAGRVLDLMIKRNSEYTGMFVKKALAYNQSVLNKLNDYIKKSSDSVKEILNDQITRGYCDESESRRETLRDYKTYVDDSFIYFRAPIYAKDSHLLRLLTNIIRVTASSKEPSIQFYIDEINKTCRSFISLKEEAK